MEKNYNNNDKKKGKNAKKMKVTYDKENKTSHTMNIRAHR